MSGRNQVIRGVTPKKKSTFVCDKVRIPYPYCFYVVRAVLYLYKLDFTAKLFIQNVTHSLSYLPSDPQSPRPPNTLSRLVFPDALFPVSSSYTVSLTAHDALLT